MLTRLITRITKIHYVRSAIDTKADLSALKRKPTRREVIGLIVIAISYILGWPAVGAFAILAAYFDKPMILIIGGPAIYGLSHLVFMLGAYLAGADHLRVLFRWLTRRGVEKLSACFGVPLPPPAEPGALPAPPCD